MRRPDTERVVPEITCADRIMEIMLNTNEILAGSSVDLSLIESTVMRGCIIKLTISSIEYMNVLLKYII